MKHTLTLFILSLFTALPSAAEPRVPTAKPVKQTLGLLASKPADELAKVIAATGMKNHLRLDLQRPIDPRLAKLKTGDVSRCGLFSGKTHMKRFTESLRKQELPGRPGIVTDAHSDWIPADISGMRPPEEPTVYGTAYYFRVVDLCARTAKALGKDAAAGEFRKWSEDIRSAFGREFLDPERNHYYGHSQTNYRQSVNAIPLHFGMVDAGRREAVGRNLVADIRDRNWHLNTGIVGTRSLMMVLPTLGDNGIEAAWKLATQTDYPSWGHMMRNGATTIWERWQGDSSLNHPAFGSVGGYFYEHLAGIQPSENHPGFEEFDVRPVFPEGLDWVKARYVSVRGDIRVEWRREGGRLSLNVSVPPVSRATIHVPATKPNGILEGGRPATPTRTASGLAVFEVGGGDYQFQSDFPAKSPTIPNQPTP